jgi:DNA-binding GntR family transcriptional regulator
MAANRPDPYRLALQTLRGQLHAGVLAPGARITATEVAEALKLSATPVREALARLSGEGLVEDRRGQGYFVRHLTAGDIADLYRLSLAHLLIAQDPGRLQLARRPADDAAHAADTALDPVAAVERLFARWVAEGAGRVLSAAHRTLQAQLGPVRRVEPLLIGDLADEARLLEAAHAGEPAERLQRLRRFHARRLPLADRLASLASRAAGDRENSADIV